MLTYQRTTLILGLICLVSTPAVSHAAPASRRPPPRISGPKDKPTVDDSRFPGHHPRPNGALLAPVTGANLRLVSEGLRIRCRFGGGGCAVHHDFVIHNSGDATTVSLPFVSPRMAVLAEVNGKRAQVDGDPVGTKPRRWSSSGQALDPSTRKTYKLPGPTRHRPLRTHRVRVTFPAKTRVTVTLITNSVGGYDRFRRPRTQPEVSFAGTRRKDHFVHHHELPLVDRAARKPPGAGPGTTVELTLSARLVLGANIQLSCKRDPSDRRQQRCTGRLKPGVQRLRWSVAEKRRRCWGLFVGAGLAFTHRGVEALLRGGASLMLRSRKDLLTLSAETDAKERFALALTYQLFLPYSPHNWELGPHFELGMVLDLVPRVRPAIRLGAALHFAVVRLNLLLDVYPGEFKKGGGPSWRGMVGAGIGF